MNAAERAEMMRLLEVLQVAIGNAALHAKAAFLDSVRGGIVATLTEIDNEIGSVFDAFEDGAYDEEVRS